MSAETAEIDDMSSAQQMNETTIFSLSESVAVQELGGTDGGVVLNLRSGEMYTVNETGVAFLQSLDGQRSVGDAADRITETFDVPRDVLIADLLELGEQLMKEGLISAD